MRRILFLLALLLALLLVLETNLPTRFSTTPAVGPREPARAGGEVGGRSSPRPGTASTGSTRVHARGDDEHAPETAAADGVPADLFVRVVPAGPWPELDLLDLVEVALWDAEPLHVFDATVEWWEAPEPLDSYGESVEGGVQFEDAPRDRPLWVSVSAPIPELGLHGVVPEIARVPEPTGARWSVELPLRAAGWVEGRVVDVPGGRWKLSCEEIGLETSGGEGEPFLLWPVPAVPLSLTLSARERGRAILSRHPVRAPVAGGLDLGTLSPAASADELEGRVRVEGDEGLQAWLELVVAPGAGLAFATDEQGWFRIQGDLGGAPSLRVTPSDSHRFEPCTVDLVAPLPSWIDIELTRRPRPLAKLILRPVDARGEYVSGDLAAVIGAGALSAARFGANHAGYCGGGIFWLSHVAQGEQPYVAWIPTACLSGVGTVEVLVADPDAPDGRGIFAGKRVVTLPLRDPGTLLTGELVQPPADRRRAYYRRVRPRVALRGDPRAAAWLDDLEPGRFALKGLPAECDFTLVLCDWRDSELVELELRLEPGEHRDLGVVCVDPVGR